MTRAELAAWCVNVTDPKEEDMSTEEGFEPLAYHTIPSAYHEIAGEMSLEAAKAAYRAKQNASRVLAEAVREARKQHSLSEIARELGVSRQRIHQISTEETS